MHFKTSSSKVEVDKHSAIALLLGWRRKKFSANVTLLGLARAYMLLYRVFRSYEAVSHPLAMPYSGVLFHLQKNSSKQLSLCGIVLAESTLYLSTLQTALLH